MSIFKTVGNKLKRVVSLKNVINGVTGNYSAIALDAKRVLTTKSPSELKKEADAKLAGQSYAPQEVAYSTFEIPSMVTTALDNAGSKQASATISKLASSKLAQDNINPANAFLSKLWFQTTWEKNKTIVIVVGVAIAGFIGRKVFAKKTTSKGRARR